MVERSRIPAILPPVGSTGSYRVQGWPDGYRTRPWRAGLVGSIGAQELQLSTVLVPNPIGSSPAAGPVPVEGVGPVIRGIAAAAEVDAARRLQRAAFDLPADTPDLESAAHPGDGDELRLVLEAGRVVSCLTLMHARLKVHGSELTMAGVRHVATDPACQNQGHGSALMRDTLRYAWRQGFAASILFPFSFRYYRKFGFELGGNHTQFWCRPSSMPAFQERLRCRAAAASDAEALERLSGRVAEGYSCSLVRPESRWRRLLSDPNRKVTVLETAGELDGYLVTEESRDSYGGRILKVLDMGATGKAAWRGLVGHLSQFPGESMEWLANATALQSSGLLRSPAPLREGFKPRGIATVRPMFQFRIVDLAGALQARLPQLQPGRYRLGFQVRDEILPENGRPLTVAGTAKGAELRATKPSDPVLTADIQVLSQIFCGYLTAEDAVSQGLATLSSEAGLEAASLLFPEGEPFLSELDRF